MALNDKKYIENLIQEQEQRREKSFKDAREFLETKGFFDMTLEDKTAFLIRKIGQTVIEELSSKRLQLLEIADCLKITQKDFTKIRKENAEIFDAIDRGRASEYNQVEVALLQSATGYYKTDTITESFSNERSPNPVIKTKTIEKWYPPNPYSNSKYLEARKKEEWYQKQMELEQQKNTIHVVFEIVGDDTINTE